MKSGIWVVTLGLIVVLAALLTREAGELVEDRVPPRKREHGGERSLWFGISVTGVGSAPYAASASRSVAPRPRTEMRGARPGGVSLRLKPQPQRLKEAPPTAPRGLLSCEPLALLAARYVVKERAIAIAAPVAVFFCLFPGRPALTLLLFPKRPAPVL